MHSQCIVGSRRARTIPSYLLHSVARAPALQLWPTILMMATTQVQRLLLSSSTTRSTLSRPPFLDCSPRRRRRHDETHGFLCRRSLPSFASPPPFLPRRPLLFCFSADTLCEASSSSLSLTATDFLDGARPLPPPSLQRPIFSRLPSRSREPSPVSACLDLYFVSLRGGGGGRSYPTTGSWPMWRLTYNK